MTKKPKITYLILGTGIGLIIASTFYSFYPQVEREELSDDIIIERAVELGMIKLKDSINTEQLQKEKKQEKEKEEVKEEVKEEAKESSYVEIEIESSDYLSDIVNKLYNLELIDNKEEFTSLTKSKNLERLFIDGKYSIKKNTDYSTIIKILTRNK